MAHQQMTAIHVLLRFLEAEGVDTIFGVPGGPITPLYEALYDRGKIRHVLAKHEEGAAYMADGYARVTGRLGVCCSPGAVDGRAAFTTSLLTAMLAHAQRSLFSGAGPGWRHDRASLAGEAGDSRRPSCSSRTGRAAAALT
ncbi:MAG: thiamine pyrophosphate-binding protein [Byssovorax sp.]